MVVDRAALSTVGPVPIAWLRVRKDSDSVLPTASVEVGNHAMPLILDTGATGHMLTEGVVWYLGLAKGPTGEQGGNVIDAHGDSVYVHGLMSVPFQVEHWQPLPPAPFLVAKMPVESRVLGFVSPQALVGDGGAVLDFPASEMRAVANGDVAAALAFGDAQQAECGCAGPGKTPLFTVKVHVLGTPISMVMDTGSGRSMLFGRGPLGRSLASRAVPTTHALAALGGTERLMELPNAKMVVGGREFQVPLGMIDRDVPPSHCAGGERTADEEGVLGIDVLKACTLVVTSSAASVRCTGR